MTGSSFSQWLAEESERRSELGLRRELRESDQGTQLLDLAGNDYLGLSQEPLVLAGAIAATRQYGAGARASRLVSGTLSIHTELEDALANFVGFASALVLSTGYHANLAVVQALADRDTLIVSDAHVHASLVDACRLSRADIVVADHNVVDSFAAPLASRRRGQRALVLVESIYSVLGDEAPLTELAAVCARHDAVLIADEAHAIGVRGPGGRGLLAEHGLTERIDVIGTGTLSKSLGSQGGFVLAHESVRDHLVNRARPFIYDTGLAPAAAGAALAALRLIKAAPRLQERVLKAAVALAQACGVAAPAGAVLSVPMAGPHEALEAVAAAAGAGVRIGCFRPPSTPDGISRLRLTAHAHHDDAQLAFAAEVLRGLVS